jgi:hypothetical protein
MIIIHNQKVFVIAVSCGLALAIFCWFCHHLIVTSNSFGRFFLDEHWPVTAFIGGPSFLLYLLMNLAIGKSPIIFPDWLAGLIAFSYYPIVSVLIGKSKHWLV